jgi:integrase
VPFEGSYKKAQLKEAELKLEVRKRKEQEKQVKRSGLMTFTEYFPYWLNQITPAIEKTTLRTYMSSTKTLSAIVGDLLLSDDTKCCQLQDRLSGNQDLQGSRPKTRKNIIGTLKTAIRYALRWDLITRDIGAGLITPKVPKKKYCTFTRSELEDQLLPTLKKYKHGLVVRLIAVCGFRTEEVAALAWPNINFKKGTARIAEAADVKGRELKQSGETKEKASVRIIDLDADTLAMLVEHREKQRQGKIASLNNLVFPADDGRPIAYRNVQRTLARACKACGLLYISPHKLRHGVAQIMDDEGASATRIAETLGHADGTVSEQLYTLSQRHGKSILK